MKVILKYVILIYLKKIISKEKRFFSFCDYPMYFSPEMLSNKGVNYKSDIYQIGLIIYKLYSG